MPVTVPGSAAHGTTRAIEMGNDSRCPGGSTGAPSSKTHGDEGNSDMTNHRRFFACAVACVAMLAGTIALAATAADAQTSNGGGNGGMGNMPGMSGMATAQSTSTRGSIFDLIRAAVATAPFHNLDVAQKFGGYGAEVADKAGITCIADPTVPSAERWACTS